MGVASYKDRLTPGKRLWENLMLNPPTDLQDLISWVEMLARLEDDVKQAKKAIGTTARGEGPFKNQKENLVDYKSWVR